VRGLGWLGPLEKYENLNPIKSIKRNIGIFLTFRFETQKNKQNPIRLPI